jgi:hypothetical protein
MFLGNWSLAFRGKRKMPQRDRSRFPHVERLEDRCVPTTVTPTTFADGGLGSGSLRDAVLQFNADSGGDDDTIQLLAGTYALTIQNPGGVHETGGLTGDLNLTQASHRWIIQGAGSSGDQATIIDADQLQDRVFQVVNPGLQVVFEHLILQGGLAQENGADGGGAGQSDALGGGLLNNGGVVTLDDVVVQNNTARGGDATQLSVPGHSARGGGIYSSGGALTLAGATLANNQVIGGRGGDHNGFNYAGNGGDALGGGLYATGGALDISNSLIAGNQATGGRGGDGFVTHSGGSTFTYGWSSGGAGQGGGLYVSGSALTLATSTLANNQVTAGAAGLYGYSGFGRGAGLDNTGMLTVSNSTFSGNTNTALGYYGGGISNTGTLTVSNSTLSGNTADSGGGIYNRGALTVSNSTLSGNTASYEGGGILNDGTLTVSNSTLSGNTATSYGGGIENDGTLMVSDSTLSGNTASHYFGGGIDNFFGTLTVSYSTLSGNTASLAGGGIRNYDGTVTVGNSTMSGNTADYGGGISISVAQSVTLTNVTVTDNRATLSGGGLYVFSASPVLHNTLIAGNFHGATGTTADDVSGNLDPSGDNNLIGDGTGMTGLQNGVHGNQVGTADNPIDPRLGPLADNGGPTLTHALLPDSPAIDAGNNAYATDFDQRGPGFPRIVNGIIDIGAFEFQGAGAGPSPSRSRRGLEAGLAELVAGLPPAVSHPVVESPALSPGQGSTITGEGPFVAPLEAVVLAQGQADPAVAQFREALLASDKPNPALRLARDRSLAKQGPEDHMGRMEAIDRLFTEWFVVPALAG